ncbi:MAG: ATP-binding protein [Spirochaetia bacterium]|jgi:two-component system chemotaxis sensor kinase CheA
MRKSENPEGESPASAPAGKKSRSAQWTEKAIEAGDFQSYQIGIIHDWLQTLTLLAAILVPLFFVLDVFMMPPSLLPRFAIYRSISAALALIQLFVVRATRPGRLSYLHGYFISAQVGGIIALMTTSLGGFSSSYYAGLNLVVIGVNLLMPWRAYHTAINALLIFLMYISFNVIAPRPTDTAVLLNNLFFLGATAVIAAAINYVRFRLLQNEFMLLVEVRGARDELQVEKDLVEDRTRSLKGLLDVSGQGFLSFDGDFLVSPEYSRECEGIFGRRIEGRKIDELLYEDPRAREDFRNGLRLYFGGTARPEVIFDLLDHQIRIGEKTVRVEYKAVHGSRVMVVLTDVTEELRLLAESRKENERKATLLKVIANRSTFASFTREAQALFSRLANPGDSYSSVIREIHTFKGNAGFVGFQKTQEAAHELEDFLSDRLTLGQTILPGEKIALVIDAYREELSIITDALGSGWLQLAESVEIPRTDYLALEKHVKANYPADRALLQALESHRKKPVAALFERFPGMAADLAARMGKRVEPLAVTGGDLPVVADDYEDLVGSFVHLIRNRVDHGIEPPGERERRGKPPAGKVSIDIKEDPQGITFTFSDDGSGIQLDKVEKRARKLGLITDGNPVSPRELLTFIFNDNFSTATRVTEVSGRGVGLPAVREAVRRAGGRISIRSAAGRGTTFTITVPRARARKGEVAS